MESQKLTQYKIVYGISFPSFNIPVPVPLRQKVTVPVPQQGFELFLPD